MSGSSAVEIDFFSRESSLKKLSADRRDIQGVISKINPELLKSAIASASANTSFFANTSFSPMPATFAPMTIFFNGNISVFDVTPDHAESVIKLAESLNSGSKSDESTLFVRPESSQNLAISRALRNGNTFCAKPFDFGLVFLDLHKLCRLLMLILFILLRSTIVKEEIVEEVFGEA
ncbi:hypothetical protein R6Q59_032493 [Mikania micrantha]|uniref:Tify domain-containing protein n=1 Tax=Mikania micrantha TaxID=192012 RepID=A0A5N6NR11_9ASTR|nr:hypothetical protein E3N88_17107 [Mikania micrantha]